MIRILSMIVAVSVGMAWLAASPSAQARLFIFGSVGQAEVSLETGAVRAVAAPEMYDPVVLDGGRYLAAMVAAGRSNGALKWGMRVWAPRTEETFTVGEFEGDRTTGEVPTIAGDANHARAFIWHLDTITSVTDAGLQDIVTGVSPVVLVQTPPVGIRYRRRLMAYAPVAEVLFVVRQDSGIELAQYSADGSFLRATPLPSAPTYMVVTSDGLRVFMVHFSTNISGFLAAYDARTGVQVGSVPLLHRDSLRDWVAGVVLDESGQRLLVENLDGVLAVRDYGLSLLYEIRYPRATVCRFDSLADGSTGEVVIVSTEWHGNLYGGAKNSRVSAVNLDIRWPPSR